VQFTADTWEGLASGAITVTFRTWTRPLAKVGAHHKVGDIVLAIDRVEQVRVGSISEADARRAGFDDRASLLGLLVRRRQGLDDTSTVYRVDFHRAGSYRTMTGAARADPDAGELGELAGRLERLDRASNHGSWTHATLRAIAERPGVVSTDLARDLGRDRPSFKLDVRKLKRLGLTESLTVGYELTPKGAAVLRHLDGSESA
jgi:hypothetical protein